jgi:caffeoyl-CoA O-methyltransferase
MDKDFKTPQSAPLANNDFEKRVLQQIARHDQDHLNVPPADGRMLRLLTAAAGAKHVVEIGTSTGYSGLWLSLALGSTGGRLTTFEADAGRAAAAREHFRSAGVDGIVTIVEGDARANVKRLNETIDVVFLDADKESYIEYFNQLLPLVRPGGLILAHNVDMVPDYVQFVTTHPALETLFYMEGNGLAITLKKRNRQG